MEAAFEALSYFPHCLVFSTCTETKKARGLRECQTISLLGFINEFSTIELNYSPIRYAGSLSIKSAVCVNMW